MVGGELSFGNQYSLDDSIGTKGFSRRSKNEVNELMMVRGYLLSIGDPKLRMSSWRP